MTDNAPLTPLPLLSFLAAFVVVLGLLWGLPAFATRAANSADTFGESRNLYFTCRESKDTRSIWSGDIQLNETQIRSRLLPQLRWDLVSQSGPNPGDCVLIIEQTLYINGKDAWGSYGQAFVDPRSANQGFANHHAPEPDQLGDLSGHFEQMGKNTVRYEIAFRLQVNTPGTAFFDWKGGPLTVQTVDADGDGDGIPDGRQPFPGVHTALVAVPLGAGAGAVAWFIVRRRTP